MLDFGSLDLSGGTREPPGDSSGHAEGHVPVTLPLWEMPVSNSCRLPSEPLSMSRLKCGSLPRSHRLLSPPLLEVRLGSSSHGCTPGSSSACRAAWLVWPALLLAGSSRPQHSRAAIDGGCACTCFSVGIARARSSSSTGTPCACNCPLECSGPDTARTSRVFSPAQASLLVTAIRTSHTQKFPGSCVTAGLPNLSDQPHRASLGLDLAQHLAAPLQYRQACPPGSMEMSMPLRLPQVL